MDRNFREKGKEGEGKGKGKGKGKGREEKWKEINFCLFWRERKGDKVFLLNLFNFENIVT